MQILVVGNGSQLEELKDKFGRLHNYLWAEKESDIDQYLKDADLVFDFDPSENTIFWYREFKNPIFINSVFSSLAGLTSQVNMEKRDSIFGFCGLPTFMNRSVMEVTSSSKKSEEELKRICAQLETDFVCVEDSVGVVTPRVISMIINEAYYTLEEGTANRGDIDLAMKLGTNYPYGPFEWAQRIGIHHLVKLLDALHQDTHDERYKVCNLLRNELKNGYS
jgi:3-hydroxybutyryl-CoA dehydrogenase